MTTLKDKSIDELAEIVSLFPWYEAARKELCVKTGEFSSSSIYFSSRKAAYHLTHNGETADFTDKDIKNLIKEAVTPRAKVRSMTGDFFSQEEYDDVRDKDDNVFSSFAKKVRPDNDSDSDTDSFMDICTETLAQIYADQGYPEQAKYIYSKLSLRYPEKNAYFAALIRKLEEKN